MSGATAVYRIVGKETVTILLNDDEDKKDITPMRERRYWTPKMERFAYAAIKPDMSNPIEDKALRAHSVTYNVEPTRNKEPKLYVVMGYSVFALIIVGMVGVVMKSSVVFGLGIPLGFTLWAILAYLLRRSDRL